MRTNWCAISIFLMYSLSWLIAFAKNEQTKGYILGIGLMLAIPLALLTRCNYEKECEKYMTTEEAPVEYEGLPKKEE